MSQSFRCNLCSAILNVEVCSIPSEVIMDFSIHSQHFRKMSEWVRVVIEHWLMF